MIWVRLALFTAGLIIFVLGLVIHGYAVDNKKKQDLIAWCDEREVFFKNIFVLARRGQTVMPKTDYYAQIDGFWNGPRFTPSATGIRQINLAMDALKIGAEAREAFLGALGREMDALTMWERTHPVPDYGIPEPPAPKDSVLRGKYQHAEGTWTKEHPSKRTEDVQSSLLNGPIYDPAPRKELST